jgi:hypothetical protein
MPFPGSRFTVPSLLSPGEGRIRTDRGKAEFTLASARVIDAARFNDDGA